MVPYTIFPFLFLVISILCILFWTCKFLSSFSPPPFVPYEQTIRSDLICPIQQTALLSVPLSDCPFHCVKPSNSNTCLQALHFFTIKHAIRKMIRRQKLLLLWNQCIGKKSHIKHIGSFAFSQLKLLHFLSQTIIFMGVFHNYLQVWETSQECR